MPPPHLESNLNDDLSVVVGRFQAWEAIQNDQQPAMAGKGVQEVTYEEALAARRLRRPPRPSLPPELPGMDATTGVASEVLAKNVLAPPPDQAVAALKELVQAATARATAARTRPNQAVPAKVSATSPSLAAPMQARQPAASRLVSKAKGVAVVKAKGLAAALGNSTAAALIHSGQQSATGKRVASSKAVPAVGPMASRSVTQKAAALASPRMAPALKREASARSGLAKRRGSRTFEGALAAAMRQQSKIMPAASAKSTPAKPASGQVTTVKAAFSAKNEASRSGVNPAVKAAPSAKLATRQYSSAESSLRSISINVRLSSAEHARVRRDASASGSTLAAYVRNCTLGVGLAKELAAPANRPPKLEPPLQVAKEMIGAATAAHPGALTIAGGFLARIRAFWSVKGLAVQA